MSSMLLHDQRLIGMTPRTSGYRITTNKNTPIANALVKLKAWASLGSRGVDDFFIFCHGYEDYDLRDDFTKQASQEPKLGFGLQIGREGLTLKNVNLFGCLNRKVKRITIYACGPANTSPGNEGTGGDGTLFCSHLAATTGAIVVASKSLQLYAPNKQKPLDFGLWEQPVYQFHPDGSYRKLAIKESRLW